MSFKPKNAGKPRTEGDFERGPVPIPKSGPRKARVSLIVDMGIQKREDFEDEKTGEKKPQKPCAQVAVFADLVQDVVDYGGTIGRAQYRLCLNKTFKGDIEGINFTATPPKDAKGQIINGKPWGFHPQNMLTKLSKAVGKPEVALDDGPSGMDISLLLNEPFIADVEVKEKESDTKKDPEGNPIIYRNVNFKGPSKVPMVETDELDTDGNAIEKPAPVAELKTAALCITFDNAKAEDIRFIRKSLINKIKLAENYAGSQMQKAIEEFEAGAGASTAADDDGGEPESQEAPKEKVTNKAPRAKPAEKKPLPKDDDDQDLPF